MSNVKMPEPITADEIRFGMRRIDADQQYIEVEQAEAYAQAVRDEALESAAKLADKESIKRVPRSLVSIHKEQLAGTIAAAIRALKKEQS